MTKPLFKNTFTCYQHITPNQTYQKEVNRKMKEAIISLLIIFLPFTSWTSWAHETLAVKYLAEPHLEGHFLTREDLKQKFGEYAYETLQKNPQIILAIVKVKPDFQEKDVGVSFCTKFFLSWDGRMIFLINGCTPHRCAGTENLIAYEPENQKACVLKESQDQESITIYGQPDRITRDLLIYWYLHRRLNPLAD